MEPLGCQGDGECPSKEACIERDCKNPCLFIKPCHRNADCKVYDTLPRRTMTCTCKEGFTGKGDVKCDKIGESLHRGHVSTGDMNKCSFVIFEKYE